MPTERERETQALPFSKLIIYCIDSFAHLGWLSVAFNTLYLIVCCIWFRSIETRRRKILNMKWWWMPTQHPKCFWLQVDIFSHISILTRLTRNTIGQKSTQQNWEHVYICVSNRSICSFGCHGLEIRCIRTNRTLFPPFFVRLFLSFMYNDVPAPRGFRV